MVLMRESLTSVYTTWLLFQQGNYLFYASASVVLPEALCILAVRASRKLLAQDLEKYWTYFHQTFIVGAFWDNDEHVKFLGSKGKSLRSRLGRTCCKNLQKCTFWRGYCSVWEITGLNCTKLLVSMHFGIRMNMSIFVVKSRSHSMTDSTAGGGMRYRARCCASSSDL